jgi:di- and tripeptidase
VGEAAAEAFADDDVSPSTPEEMQLLEDVAKACGRSVDDLVKVWRHPSFSIANISSSGASNKTVIPKKVTADISMRIVPDQVSSATFET